MSATVKVNANPTKEFFIYMLTRDIGLSRAILDLVDNSIDGALRIRGDSEFKDLFVRIELGKDSFSISDNCGGIDIEIAKEYAFRFGRPNDAVFLKNSIGQFGVGMKRALFKLGIEFDIESSTTTDQFILSDNVELWKDKLEWDFEMVTDHFDIEKNITDCGTKIIVKKLYSQVSEAFETPGFIKDLSIEIELAHQDALRKGISIMFNGIPLKYSKIELLYSDQLKPAKKRNIVTNLGKSPITISILAGLGDSNPQDAGWYIFCNGRMVLNADQTYISGWGEEIESLIPKFHNRFAMFRGYVFFDSEDAGQLPWNTTKTGIDSDSKLYKSTRQEMITMMRPVLDFLNALSREKEPEIEEKILTDIVSATSKSAISDILDSQSFFILETQVASPMPATSIISYRKDIETISKVKEKLGVSSNKEVGERTFEYYLMMEPL